MQNKWKLQGYVGLQTRVATWPAHFDFEDAVTYLLLIE